MIEIKSRLDKWFIMLGKDDPKGKKQKAPSCDGEAAVAGLFQIVIRRSRFLKTRLFQNHPPGRQWAGPGINGAWKVQVERSRDKRFSQQIFLLSLVMTKSRNL